MLIDFSIKQMVIDIQHGKISKKYSCHLAVHYKELWPKESVVDITKTYSRSRISRLNVPFVNRKLNIHILTEASFILYCYFGIKYKRKYSARILLII